MPFDINTFRSALQYDGARPNLFEVYMTFPGNVLNSATASQEITFLCKASQLPGKTIGTTPEYYFGREIKLPGNATYADWTITIINDEDFLIRNAFENWQDLLNAAEANVRDPSMVNYLGYSVNPSVIQYGKSGNAIKQYDFQGVWPMDVAPIDLDWSSNDSVEEFQVTLGVQYWTSTIPVPATST